VVLGVDDDITPEQARGWQLETLRPLSLSYFAGGHFFIREHAAKLAALVGGALCRAFEHSEAGGSR
jgi:surfactin synthase thioesterase subunit